MGVSQANTFGHRVDPAVVTRLQQGDLEAFERVYRDFEHATYTLALRLTGRPDVAGEVLQDAMLKAFEKAGQFRADAPFGAWLKRLVVNEALARLRRERRHRSETYEDVHVDETPGSPWQLVDAAVLDRALARLPGTTRAVLWLYHVEGYTHREIANHFNRSTSFSKSQLARGMQRLRRLLEPDEEASPCLTGTATSS